VEDTKNLDSRIRDILYYACENCDTSVKITLPETLPTSALDGKEIKCLGNGTALTRVENPAM
jgi:hypothetical protein